MILAQPLLLAIVFLLAWFYFTRVSSRSSDRVLFGVLAGSLVIVIIQPSLATEIANSLGIGRGADLLLYLFSFFVLFCLILIHRKLRDLERVEFQVIRALSIMNAKKPDTTSRKRVDPADSQNTPLIH